MNRKVKDGLTMLHPKANLMSVFPRRRLIASLALTAILTPAIASGQSNFSVNVRQIEHQVKRVTVPLNRSVIVETNAPATRTQVVESGIAKIESVTATQFLLTGVGYGSTQVMLWSDSGQQQVLEVNVELDMTRLNELVHTVDPMANAMASSVNGNIVLTGTVTGSEKAEQLVALASLFAPQDTQNPGLLVQNHLRVAGEQQVLLRTTVAEISRSAARQLGINGFLAGDDFQDVFVVNQLGGINPANLGAAAGANVQGTIPFLTGEGGVPLLPTTPLSIGFPRIQMQLFLQAMADNNLLRILAEPNLVAVSGETASFLAGGEFPIPVPQSGSAAGSVTIEFREFGVRMNFTPQVLGGQRIRLHVAPEVSETDFSNAVQIQGFVVPGLTQRRVETTIEVGSGQTLAIAGLLSDEVRGVASRIPALGDVPVLGALFRSVNYQRRETELVVLVTPEIVAPVDPQHVPRVPGEDYITPNDYELYALGLLDGETPPEATGEPVGAYRTDSPTKVAPLQSEPSDMSVRGPWGASMDDDL